MGAGVTIGLSPKLAWGKGGLTPRGAGVTCRIDPLGVKFFVRD